MSWWCPGGIFLYACQIDKFHFEATLKLVKEIPLSGGHGKGKVAIVDDDDFYWLRQFTWCLAHGYAQTTVHGNVRKYMHQLLLPRKPGLVTDHINRNKLDNRRANLRRVTHADNQRNTVARNASGLKGVYLRKRPACCVNWPSPWAAYARYGGIQYHLGCFATKEEAAQAYVNFIDKAQHEGIPSR